MNFHQTDNRTEVDQKRPKPHVLTQGRNCTPAMPSIGLPHFQLSDASPGVGSWVSGEPATA